jgi:invasion protein IalB
MAIQLPLGLNLTEPVQLKVDNGQPERHPIQTCTNVGCIVQLTAPDRFVTAMRNGTDLKVSFQGGDKKQIELSVPLLGFGIAFDKVRT